MNLGLVGKAELAPDALDATGETLGACFSGMWWDSPARRLYGLADRGPLDGHLDYHPRVHEFSLSVDLIGQPKLALSNTITRLLRDERGCVFTGHDPGDKNANERSASGSRSIDPEAIVCAPDGSFYVSDEYGPYVYHFDASFQMVDHIEPPPISCRNVVA